MILLQAVLQAAEEVQAFCMKQGWRFCFIGGVALQRWGEPRSRDQSLAESGGRVRAINAKKAADRYSRKTIDELKTQIETTYKPASMEIPGTKVTVVSTSTIRSTR